MVSRIGTFANANALVQASMSVQAQLADEQVQQATQVKSTTFSGLSGEAGQLLNIQGQSARVKEDGAAATTAGNVVQAAYSAVGGIADIATQVRTRLSAALSGTYATGVTPITSEQAQSWLSSLQSQLNTQIGGQYVFGGQATDHAPVDFSSAGYDPTTAPAAADTGYYSGSSNVRSLTTSTGQTVQISTTANSPGFEMLARALKLLAANPTDQTTLQSAFDQVGQAVADIAQSQATLSDQAATLNAIATNATTQTTTLNNLATTLNGADLASAAVMVSQYQTQLQALYQSIGQLSSLSILKYLS
jgi:flagellar hook-associated protein 3 FlgL